MHCDKRKVKSRGVGVRKKLVLSHPRETANYGHGVADGLHLKGVERG